jgi:hypothetical protein
MVGEEVGDSVGVSRDVVEHKVEVLQEFHPSGLPARDLLWLTKVLEVFMICSNMNGVFGAKEVGRLHLNLYMMAAISLSWTL